MSLSGTAGGIDISSCNTSSTPMDCILDGTILDGATGITLGYSGAPADAIENAGEVDLEDFADEAVTNSSDQETPDTTLPVISTVTIPAAGTTIIISANETVTESGDGTDWALDMSGAAVTLDGAAPSVNGGEITYTLSRTIVHNETFVSLAYVQPGNGIEDIADNDLASIADYSGTFDNNSMSGKSTWGDTTADGMTPATIDHIRYMGGTSPDVADMVLEEVYCYFSGTGTARLAVYQGGALDDPTGAALLWDAGTVAISGEDWYVITGGSDAFARDEVTWIGWKGEGFNYFATGTWDATSDFENRGRFNSTTEDIASSNAWDDPFAATGSFNDYFYPCYVVYSTPAADVVAPVLLSATIAADGKTLTLVFTEVGSDVQQGSGYADADWDIDTTASLYGTQTDIALTYVSGNNSNTHIYTLATVVYEDDTVNIDFNGDAHSEEDDEGNDLAAIVSTAVTNNAVETTKSLEMSGGSQSITRGGSQTITF